MNNGCVLLAFDNLIYVLRGYSDKSFNSVKAHSSACLEQSIIGAVVDSREVDQNHCFL